MSWGEPLPARSRADLVSLGLGGGWPSSVISARVGGGSAVWLGCHRKTSAFLGSRLCLGLVLAQTLRHGSWLADASQKKMEERSKNAEGPRRGDHKLIMLRSVWVAGPWSGEASQLVSSQLNDVSPSPGPLEVSLWVLPHHSPWISGSVNLCLPCAVSALSPGVLPPSSLPGLTWDIYFSSPR